MTLWQRAQMCADGSVKVDELMDKSWKYWAPLFAGVVSVLIAASDIYMAVTRFNDLTPAGKAKSIVACIKSVMITIGHIPGMIATVKGKQQWHDLRAAARRASPSAISIELQAFGPGEARPRSLSAVSNSSSASDLEPTHPKAKSGWSKGGRRFFEGVMTFLSVGLAILSVWELFQDKDGFSSGYWLFCLQVSVQVLQAVVEIVAFFSASSSATSTVCAFLGPALALVGIVFIILSIFLSTRKRTKTTKAEDWIDGKGNTFTNGCDDPPSPKLTWTMSPDSGAAGSEALVTIVGTNNSAGDAVFHHIATRLTTGSSANTWFSTQQTEDWSDSDAGSDTSKLKNNQVAVSLSSGGSIKSSTFSNDPVQIGATEKAFSRNFQVLVRNSSTTLALTVPKGATLTLQLRGVLGKKGEADDPNNVFPFSIEETWIDNKGVVTEVVSQHFTFTRT